MRSGESIRLDIRISSANVGAPREMAPYLSVGASLNCRHFTRVFIAVTNAKSFSPFTQLCSSHFSLPNTIQGFGDFPIPDNAVQLKDLLMDFNAHAHLMLSSWILISLSEDWFQQFATKNDSGISSLAEQHSHKKGNRKSAN